MGPLRRMVAAGVLPPTVTRTSFGLRRMSLAKDVMERENCASLARTALVGAKPNHSLKLTRRAMSRKLMAAGHWARRAT